MKLTLISTTLLLLRCLINSCFAALLIRKAWIMKEKPSNMLLLRKHRIHVGLEEWMKVKNFSYGNYGEMPCCLYFFTGSIKMRSCGMHTLIDICCDECSSPGGCQRLNAKYREANPEKGCVWEKNQVLHRGGSCNVDNKKKEKNEKKPLEEGENHANVAGHDASPSHPLSNSKTRRSNNGNHHGKIGTAHGLH